MVIRLRNVLLMSPDEMFQRGFNLLEAGDPVRAEAWFAGARLRLELDDRAEMWAEAQALPNARSHFEAGRESSGLNVVPFRTKSEDSDRKK